MLLPCRVQQLLEQTELAIATDEWRLEARGTERAAGRGDDMASAPQAFRVGLTLQLVHPGVVVDDCRLGCNARRITDVHGPGLSDGLDPGRRVDEVTRDHPLSPDTES